MLPADPNELALEAPRCRFRKLRIAWSVGWGIVCLLLVVLWVRSYCARDNCTLIITHTRTLLAESAVGQFGLFLCPGLRDERLLTMEYFHVPVAVDPDLLADNRIGFEVYCSQDYAFVVVPHWLLILLTGIPALAQTIGRPRRLSFSLRTMLIAMTLIAVLLGMVMLFAR